MGGKQYKCRGLQKDGESDWRDAKVSDQAHLVSTAAEDAYLDQTLVSDPSVAVDERRAWMSPHTLLIFPVMSPGLLLLVLATKPPGLASKPGRVFSQGELQAGNSPDGSSPSSPTRSPRPGTPREGSGGACD
ncbi:hypothetical protein P7K49_019018 [Saguinus oedipus]|uniref:Uncharacterized protein n=1 Tax=Saguinus oedipus TaxID=9490 RepID=A0ABQ9UWG4_SAGOE|nr:hypothetical protein P7K49_019018 [Saguinus oedipus]